eukprot:CAMPEP_0168739116 /NCGR_PEP_ID=MMETSP0724-20121128/11287_1 /TAXON_ID=265536 /ORGANISM="Amphiprora sp., Strain CCMP467" /LENGTH=571 /DNA_ID=CAMNT_0008786489 /DNA_START=26 /DNA_END=1741 /DNA_ORIENTATION=-
MTTTASTYHPGELAAQDKAGTRGVAAELLAGKTDTLSFSKNHDAFLAAQSFAVVSSVESDSGGAMWVTPLFGQSGDLTAVSETEIAIRATAIPPGDFLHSRQPHSPISLLGIDLNRRIRHRINGYVNEQGNLQVTEYSPNCPKYINRREIIPSTTEPMNQDAVRQERTALTSSDQDFLQNMDTLWIGSYAKDKDGGGADVNHRGGKPGMIRVTSPRTFEWPEYRGNGMFYTSGNIEVNDKAGVTVVDFTTGSMIQMTGRAVVDWNHDGSYEGATRVMKFTLERLVRTDHVTNHRWKRLDYSPYSPNINGTADNDEEDSIYPMPVTLAKIVTESRNVKTFRWVASRNIPFLPGQYATFEFKNIESQPQVRTWTLSETPNSIHGDNTLDITVKRIPGGLVTNWLHDYAETGLQITLLGVQGEMTAITRVVKTNNEQQEQPTVPENLILLSAGIGITPNVAMVRGVGAFVLQQQTKIQMIHVERYEEDLIYQSELQRRARNYPYMTYTNVISSKEGRLNQKKLSNLLTASPWAGDMKQQEAYICGPTTFMTSMTEHLVALGVPAANIHTESFEF